MNKKTKKHNKRQAYTARMKDKGFFYLCRWIRLEKKDKCIEALRKINKLSGVKNE